MNLILLGPPGAGKGTQALRLAEARGYVPLSTGDILREAIAEGTDVGRRAKSVMAAGELVSDEVIVELISERLDSLTPDQAFILDGVPRNIAQADAVDSMLAAKGRRLGAVIELRVDDDQLVERVTGRFTCTQCGAGYHDTFRLPRQEGVCNACGGTEFRRRSDDNADALGARLEIYHTQTAPLLDYYRNRGELLSVDGMADADDVARQIEEALDGL